MVIVMFSLSVTVYDIVIVKIYMTMTFRMGQGQM